MCLDNKNSATLALIYRSPNSDKKYCDELNILIEKLAAMDTPNLIIMGDFNFRKINWRELDSGTKDVNSPEDLFLNTVLDNYLIQHIQEPTRYRDGQESTLLDLVLTKDDDVVTRVSFQPPLGKSDHLVLCLETNWSMEIENQDLAQKFCLNAGDYDTIRNNLGQIDWYNIFSGQNLEEIWTSFKNIIQLEITSHIPLKKNQTNRKPIWMNLEAKQITQEKKQAWLKYWFVKTPSNFKTYRKIRNKASHVLKKARKQYEEKIASDVKDNPKLFWTYIRSHMKVRQPITKLVKDNGELTKSDEEAAETFNNYFCSVFTKDKQSLPSLSIPDNLEPSLQISRDSVISLLNKLKTDTSPGPDQIHPKILYEIRNEIVEPLTYIFNKSLSESELPSDWKNATVVPIFKKGKKNLASNYRPISLTSVICKLLEKFVRNKLLDHLIQNNLICDEQFGFIPGRSCSLQLLDIMEIWTKSIDEKIPVDVIYTDFAKAFDTVSHRELLYKLQNLGITGKLLKWIQNFLSNRKQQVKVKNSISLWQSVCSGVPQGSVLGPILFVYFINDLPSNVSNNCIRLFADDAKLSGTVKNYTESLTMQESINSICYWTENCSLNLNIDKCKVLHLGSKNQKFSYTMPSSSGQSCLQVVECEKDLGVQIDNKLSFSSHITDVTSKSNRILGLIKRSFRYMGKETFVKLYKSLIRPILEYACTVWSPFLIKDKRSLENIQRRATKLIPGLKDLPYPDRLKSLGLPTLEYRRLRADMLQTYRIMTGIDHLNPECLFVLSQDTRIRGHKYRIYKQRCSSQMRRNFFSFRVVDLWNSLPAEVVESPNINIFKNRLNYYWKDNPIKFCPSFM